MLSNTVTIQNLASLNHPKRWWFRITLNPSLSHKCVVGLQSQGGSMVDWAWFCIINFKKDDFINTHLKMLFQPQEQAITIGRPPQWHLTTLCQKLFYSLKMKFVAISKHYYFTYSTQLAQTCLVTKPIASLLIKSWVCNIQSLCPKKKVTYSMHVVGSFHHVKHKCSWMAHKDLRND